MVFDYAIFVQCESKTSLHDYSNGLIHKRILFDLDSRFTKKKSPRISCAGFSWLCCEIAAGRFRHLFSAFDVP